MQMIGEIFGVICLLAVIGAQIWLILIIMRGSPPAALLCLVVPFLVLFFIRDHWEAARMPVFIWAGSLFGFIATMILMSLLS